MRGIYLDHAATTPVRPEVVEAMEPYAADRFGNPSSVHRWGQQARAALEEARERLAAAVGAARREIVFTGSGTEADNLAVLGRWLHARRAGGPAAVACSAVEHKAVLAAVRAAAREGAEALILAVDEEGRTDLGAVEEALRSRPCVLSVMWGNNETGVLQPVEEIAGLCREAGVVFHSDAVQALGRVPVRVDRVPCDLLTVSAHKIGGPKGIGALYVRSGVDLEPLLHGGGQEAGLRPGTQDVAAAVGFAVAAELAVREQAAEAERLAALRDRLEKALVDGLPGTVVNGGGAPRLPHIMNVSVPGVDQESVLVVLDLEGVAASSGSACTSGAVELSHVLTAMGRTADERAASVRLSLGRTTTAAEVDEAARIVVDALARMRAAAEG